MATAVEPKLEQHVATKSPSKTSSKMHRRSRSGCFTCRLRRKKCDEGKPQCRACGHLGLSCEYKRPIWWSNSETRRKQKDEIKQLIKKTKTTEKNAAPIGAGTRGSSHHLSSHHHATMQSGVASPSSSSSAAGDDYDTSFDPSFATTPFFHADSTYGSMAPMYGASMTQTPIHYHPPGFQPYEVDVKTERQMFVNDVPTRRDSSISTFSTWVPPPPHAMLPSYSGDEWSTTQHHQHQHQHQHQPQHTTHSTDSYYMQPHHDHQQQQPLHSLDTDLDDLSNEEDLDFNFFAYSHATPGHAAPPTHPLPSTQLDQHPKEFTPTTDAVSAFIPLEDHDRPLFSYMLTHVLPLLFPILNANQHGSVRSDILLPALENNKAYLHSCLTAAAVHQKAALALPGAPSLDEPSLAAIEDSIVRHRYSFVQEVVAALSNDTSHDEILEATLGMISFSTCVGRAPPSTLPTTSLPSPQLDAPDTTTADIPWHSHFQAATELVTKLALPQTLESMPSTGQSPPFNMTLAAWIDILGSTMLGRSPTFANTYRTKHLSGSPSGLAELMGCHDGVMYLLSEIACLDSLKRDGKLDEHAICSHVASLGEQLNATEHTTTLDPTTGQPMTVSNAANLAHPYSRSGALRPRQLSKTITAIFQKAARVYLCSLVPHYTRAQPATMALIDAMTDMLQYVPVGPNGFDRSLVWPYLICGANSVPGSNFRRVLAERIELMGEDFAETGSFGRMVRLLHEVWRRSDAVDGNGCEATPVTAGGASPIANAAGGAGATVGLGTPILSAGGNGGGNGMAAPVQAQVTPTKQQQPQQQQSVHWRDVMQMNGWDFLLI